ncbi:hypothetical protein G6F45_013954 [Rhizopus arrhizus]|uniref:Integrase catalytic domain-containing protein n=1 Tax=Rhizopus delemar TaxID=936053 RepID=A0A9P6XQR9_9FUNG|nr:hypothetical protein G6F52_013908 [Rhizopus delemar]KAG1530323.1 hypothetical protein G6F50_017394 [Rhizopus delemar]KAG1606555.1 hypothetical protein G6F45_013954 [Rhizopus arrhizus]
MVDLFSRFTILKAIPDKQALTIAKQLVDIFCTFGWPKVIASDNGKEFTATIVTELINNSGIDKRVSGHYELSTHILFLDLKNNFIYLYFIKYFQDYELGHLLMSS